MKKLTFIWDLDGTLIDSYVPIMEALEETYRHFGLIFDKELIHECILQESVGQLLVNLSEEEQIPHEKLKAYFTKEQESRDSKIHLMPYAKEILEWTKEQDIPNFMYTHKGASTHSVLETLQISHYFDEILTGVSGFERKPHPQGINYLVKRYSLDKSMTYYIGDRPLDLEVAQNAGIKSINLRLENSKENYNISSLKDIISLDFTRLD
ncbi:TPA: HAD-IA family hydrolase [Streptococcus agalactiae]